MSKPTWVTGTPVQQPAVIGWETVTSSNGSQNWNAILPDGTRVPIASIEYVSGTLVGESLSQANADTIGITRDATRNAIQNGN